MRSREEVLQLAVPPFGSTLVSVSCRAVMQVKTNIPFKPNAEACSGQLGCSLIWEPPCGAMVGAGGKGGRRDVATSQMC